MVRYGNRAGHCRATRRLLFLLAIRRARATSIDRASWPRVMCVRFIGNGAVSRVDEAPSMCDELSPPDESVEMCAR